MLYNLNAHQPEDTMKNFIFLFCIFLISIFYCSCESTSSSKQIAKKERPTFRKVNRDKQKERTVKAILVANNKGGTVSVIDAHSLDVIDEIDVIPDVEAQNKKSISLKNRFLNYKIGIKYADDIDVLPDSQTLIVSRPVFDDIAALDLNTHELLWTLDIGKRPDHQVMTKDGKFLFVSLLADSEGVKIDLDKQEIVGFYQTGEGPHSIVFNHDESLLYNGSLRDPIIVVVNPKTLDVIDTLYFNEGVRPFKITDDNQRILTQLSYYHGLVEYDILQKTVLRKIPLPIPDFVREIPKDNYPFMAAHHGISISPDRKYIASVGTVSNYVAFLTYPELKIIKTLDAGVEPSWATNGFDGDLFFVSVRGNNIVKVYSYSKQELVKTITVGDYPQRMTRAVLKWEQ